MIGSWYRNWIGRYVSRKLNIGVATSLLIVFVAIGYATYDRFYTLLEMREQDLLDLRTEHLSHHLDGFITQFKRETIAFYPLGRDPAGTYQRFLKENVPSTDADRIHERNYVSNLQSYLLERNPRAMSVLLYRKADERLFAKTRYPSAEWDERFDVRGFFEALPQNYEYPYIGVSNRFYENIERPVLYFVNPIFDFQDIHYDRAVGYFVMGIDSRTIFELFQGDDERDLQLVIRQRGRVLVHNVDRTVDSNAEERIEAISVLPRYGLEIVGTIGKSSIEAQLTKIAAFIAGGLLAAWIACLALIHYILRFAIRRVKDLIHHFKRVQTNPFVEPMQRSGDDEIGELIERFNRMTEELKNYINRVYVAEMQKSNAEFLALKMQINPHFLYNTLESLRMQAVIHRQTEIANKLFYLGRLYRWILRADAEEITVEEELQYTRYYLELLMMGKSKQIELEAESELDVRDCFMPKFSLQPIIENAIRHGELESADAPSIRLVIREEPEHRWIEIVDNGKGAPAERIGEINDRLRTKTVFRSEHLGLKNIHERIRTLYGEHYGLEALPPSGEGGFRLAMRLPKERKRFEEESFDA